VDLRKYCLLAHTNEGVLKIDRLLLAESLHTPFWFDKAYSECPCDFHLDVLTGGKDWEVVEDRVDDAAWLRNQRPAGFDADGSGVLSSVMAPNKKIVSMNNKPVWWMSLRVCVVSKVRL
jgi:hypothetical protein